MRSVRAVITGFVVVGAVAAMLATGEGTQSEAAGPAPEQDAFGASLSTDQAIYRSGEPIRITFEVFNHTPAPVRFDFPSRQRYDLLVEDPEGEESWRWSADRMFAMVLGQETLGPGKPRLVYEADCSARLEPGTYEIKGFLTAVNRAVSATITVEVR